ncbi:MAG TPA: pitrilysin family protein, partial [Chitinophagaceae bacterium]|nr:pitrilysin family protein [Chitinophagaceae bacterium]
MNRRNWMLSVLLLVSASTALSQAKHEWKQASSGGYTYKYVTGDPTNSRFYTLKNGLTVVLSVNKKEPRIATQIAVRTGSNNDPADHTGLAHYLEHLLFKGTDKFGTLDWAKEKPLLDKIDALYESYNSTTDPEKRKEIYKEIDRISGEASKFSIANEYDKLMASIGSQGTNAHTWVEETVYEEDIPSNAVEKFLTIQAERFRNPIFRIFHTELEAVYEEKNISLDSDGRKVQEAMFQLVFPTHNYGLQSTIGTVEHLKNPSLVAIRDYYQKYYVPNNMAIIMAGDFNPDQVVKMIDQKFSYMKARPVVQYKGPEQAPIAGPVIKEVFGPSAESLRVIYRVGANNTKESLLASVTASILSNGKAGLFDLNLNKQQKLQGAGAGIQQYRDYGMFVLTASPKQGQTLEEARELLMEQIDVLRKGNFEESLIKAIVANYKLAELQALESNGARVAGLVDSYIKHEGKEWNKDVSVLDDMGALTKKDIVDFANKFFGDKNYVVIYKRKGEDKNIVKVEKPSITPIETNAGQQSPFVKQINATELPAIKPVWLNYSTDIRQARAGNAEVLYVQNKDNSIFNLYYYFDMGTWNNKFLSIALQYLQFIGTDKYSAEDISKQFYNLACSFNASAGAEQT